MQTALSHPVYIAAKAALAALLALTSVEALGIEDRLSATFVSVVCTSPTVFTGIRRGLGQLVASCIGGVITLLLMRWAPPAVTLLAALFATIWLSFLIRFGADFVVAAFTVLYVLLIPGDAAHTLESRMASVAIGVLCAMAVNLAVSFGRRRSVFGRRLRIAVELTASELERAAGRIRTPPEGPDAGAELFEPTFQVVRILADELADARREPLSSARWKTQVAGADRATQALLAVAHHGKDVILAWQEERNAEPEVADGLQALADAMRRNEPVDLGEPGAGLARRALPAAARAWRRAQQGLAAFGATGPVRGGSSEAAARRS